jgi:hypothetical protein
MEKPFDIILQVLLPDGTKQEVSVNLFDFKKEFPCFICAAIGEDEKISMQSWSDHFARHYVENNRATKINEAVTADLAKPALAPAQRLGEDALLRYDQAVTGAVGRAVHWNQNQGNAVNYVNYPAGYDEVTEEQLIRLAMEESLRESELAEKSKNAVTPAANVVPPITTKNMPDLVPINTSTNTQTTVSTQLTESARSNNPNTIFTHLPAAVVVPTEATVTPAAILTAELNAITPVVVTPPVTQVVAYPKRKKKDT